LLVVFAFVSNGDGFAQSIETFDVPNAIQTNPAAINAAGQITGSYADANSRHGFVRDRDGKIVTFDASGSNYTSPQSINSEGQIAGYYQLPDKSYHGFLRERDGTILSFDGCGGTGSYQDIRPVAINSAGQITGQCVAHGFLREPDGTITAIDDDPSDPNHPHFCGGQPCRALLQPLAINAAGQITGVYHLSLGIDGYTYGFLRQPDGTIVRFFASPESPSKFEDTVPRSINKEGQITGSVNSPVGTSTHGFLRQADGTITRFDLGNTRGTFPVAINAAGQITGHFYMNPYPYTVHGFLRETDGTVVTFDVPNSTSMYETALNDAGYITGY
jgi:hypothetical protein